MVDEVMRPLPLRALTHAHACVLGAALIRGAPIPVVDVRALTTGDPEAQIERFVVVRVGGGRRVALATAGVMGVLPLSALSMVEAPPLLSDAACEAVDALGRLDGEFVMLLRAARLLPEGAIEVGQEVTA
jgi:purine-binding chemotaxis protein CheW